MLYGRTSPDYYPPHTMKKSMNRAYVAGLLDGEGCVTLEATRRTGKVFIYPRIYVGMSARARAVLDMLQADFGGRIKKVIRHSIKHHEGATLTICGTGAILLLKEVLPFLILKKNQAKLAVAAHNLLESRRQMAYGKMWTPALTRKMETMLLQMKTLNKRGN